MASSSPSVRTLAAVGASSSVAAFYADRRAEADAACVFLPCPLCDAARVAADDIYTHLNWWDRRRNRSIWVPWNG